MAYIIGLVTKKEKEELERRGWEVEDPPPCDEFKSPTDRYAIKDGIQYRMVYVDNDMFEIMSGPDWDKGEENEH